MDEITLDKAIRIKKEADQWGRYASLAYNSHIYLKIELDGENVTGMLDTKSIADDIYKQLIAKRDKVRKELKEL